MGVVDKSKAVDTLRNGGVIAIPTDTVYGVACIPRLHTAVRTIFELKGRPDAKPLPVLGNDIGALETVARFDEVAVSLARRFWPGPLTLVLSRAPEFDHDLGGDDVATVAVRIPRHHLALELLGETGPLAVTSANLSGAAPATTPEEVDATFGDRVDCLDGGRCDGVSSTVMSLVAEPRVLREGPIAAGELLGAIT